MGTSNDKYDLTLKEEQEIDDGVPILRKLLPEELEQLNLPHMNLVKKILMPTGATGKKIQIIRIENKPDDKAGETAKDNKANEKEKSGKPRVKRRKKVKKKILKKIEERQQEEYDSDQPKSKLDELIDLMPKLTMQDRQRFKVLVLSEEQVIQEREEESKTSTYSTLQYKCHQCLIGFYNEGLLEDHDIVYHKERSFTEQCPICHVQLSRKDRLDHKREHYIRYQCTLCRTVYKNLTTAHQHYLQHAIKLAEANPKEKWAQGLKRKRIRKYGPKVTCPYCSKTFINSYVLKVHTENIHADRPLVTCDVCDRSYIGDFNLRVHKRTVHRQQSSVPDPEAYCDDCKIQFKSKYYYRHHLKTSVKHSNKEKIKCPLCENSYSNAKMMKHHYDFAHFNIGDTCEVCNKLCPRPYGLRNHMRVVHTQRQRNRNHVCETCGKGFFTKTSLNEHVRVHSDERPLQCDMCEATFKFKASLFTHKRLVHLKMERNVKKRETNELIVMQQQQQQEIIQSAAMIVQEEQIVVTGEYSGNIYTYSVP